mgnify:FL=1
MILLIIFLVVLLILALVAIWILIENKEVEQKLYDK